MWLQRVQQNVFAGALGLMGTIHATAALRLADHDPVGGAVTGSGVGPVHQGLQQQGPHSVGNTTGNTAPT